MGRASSLTEKEKLQIWELRARGEPFGRIGQGVGRSRATVKRYINSRGGVRPRPAKRAGRELSAMEREEISRGLATGESCRTIARRLQRAASTVSREVARNGGRRRYRAATAETAAWRRHRRPKLCKLALSPRLRAAVEECLRRFWSPQQISRWLKLEFPGELEMHISHETIYLSLYMQSRGTLRKELTAYLRRRHLRRRPPGAASGWHRTFPEELKISQRPAEASDRAVPGHWEGDLLLGKPTDAIGVLVERSTRYVMLFQLPGAAINSEAFREALASTVLRLPESLRRSLTWDRGQEMAEHAQFSLDTGLAIYFCDPYSPWQRGTNENTNGLLRDYFPKGQSLRQVPQTHLDWVADELNQRPRQTLGWRTPAQAFEHLLLTNQADGDATTA